VVCGYSYRPFGKDHLIKPNRRWFPLRRALLRRGGYPSLALRAPVTPVNWSWAEARVDAECGHDRHRLPRGPTSRRSGTSRRRYASGCPPQHSRVLALIHLHCISSHVTVRLSRRRQPHRAARRATRWSPRPSSASLPAGRGSGTPGPLRSVTSTRITPFSALTATVTVSPGAPEPLCRRLLEKSSPTSNAATSPHGCPGPSSPSTNARASRARSARPASVTVSRTARPAITAPAFPAARIPGNHAGRRADTCGCTLDSAANVKPGHPPERAPEPRQAATHTAPWPRFPSAMRPWTPQHNALQRYKVTHHGTEKKRPASARIRS
jgi:hypothetical protein